MEVTRKIIITAVSLIICFILVTTLLSAVRRGKNLNDTMKEVSVIPKTQSSFDVADYDKLSVSGTTTAELITYTLDVYDTYATVKVDGKAVTKKNVKKIIEYGHELFVDPMGTYYVEVTEDDFGALTSIQFIKTSP